MGVIQIEAAIEIGCREEPGGRQEEDIVSALARV
jgi:hypothetical protein